MSEKDFELAKKIAKTKIKTAGEVKHIKDTSGYDVVRQNLENYYFNEKGLKSVAYTYNHLAKAFSHLVQASNVFNKIKSSQVSPDGKLGGKGYVQPIRQIRSSLADSINVVSELLDTFYDEVSSPYWKKQTFEDNPIVNQILAETDDLLEDVEEKLEKLPEDTKI